MKIGEIELGERPVLLAPMEDVTDISFRLLCKEFGAAMVYTEFVSSDALVRRVNKTWRKLEIRDEERPVAIQIYGKDPDAMAEAARICEESSPDIIDINFGCPVKKVAGKGAGAGLLKDIPRLLEITRRVVRAVKLPVTVKTRLGWDQNTRIITELAEQLQDCGIAALAVHGRTRNQLYTGEADWTLIGEIKNNPRIHIPVIGNGDIISGPSAKEKFDHYGVDAIMVGRAAIGRPWIFKEITAYLHHPDHNFSLTWQEKMQIIHRQILESVARTGEKSGILHVRRHLATTPLFKGIPDFRPTRIAMLRAETLEELFCILHRVEKMIENNI